MNKHTPGPWRVNHADNDPRTRLRVYTNGTESLVADCDGATPDSKANARLIAAAPELLARLELAQRYLTHPEVLKITRQMALSGEAVNERIAEAIARARGGE